MRNRTKMKNVASGLRSASVVAERAPLALSNAFGARMCRGTIFLNVILHNYDHGKEKMIEERKFNLNLT